MTGCQSEALLLLELESVEQLLELESDEPDELVSLDEAVDDAFDDELEPWSFL